MNHPEGLSIRRIFWRRLGDVEEEVLLLFVAQKGVHVLFEAGGDFLAEGKHAGVDYSGSASMKAEVLTFGLGMRSLVLIRDIQIMVGHIDCRLRNARIAKDLATHSTSVLTGKVIVQGGYLRVALVTLFVNLDCVDDY